MIVCKDDFKIPIELQGEDVHDMLCIFDNEDEAVDYIVKEYKVDRNSFVLELHEEDFMRDEFGKENYLRTASISSSLHLTELMSGEYILWKAF
ncbi:MULTISPECIES: hypothetical protein [unclassified Clostridium]|uniref:hypothetical protein n=1 Tax=unclassified Clostridium TaxID=2614128 RepID=UPI0025BCC86A|nr:MULTISPECIES: hypothetical protein [unclassified Clostridium]